MKSKKYNWKLHNKTVKHPYTGSKRIDKSCRVVMGLVTGVVITGSISQIRSCKKRNKS